MNGKSVTMNGKETTKDVDKPEAGKFRTILPQILASTAKNFLLLDLGMALSFPTVVIPALRGLKHADPNEILRFTDVQASWFASIMFVFQPIGSVLSGIVLEPLGRKRSMILVNFPHIVGWLMFYFATTLEEMYGAAVLLGLGVGFMEAPIVTYVGEICQPGIRGILTSCAGVAVTLGFTLVYLFGSLTNWRNTAFYCCAVPITTAIAICFVPETPMWLLSKGRKEDAMKSLQWLRGWVSPKAVEQEFQEVVRYSEDSNRCVQCHKQELKCTHKHSSASELLKELRRKRTLKPFMLVLIMFGFCQFSGLSGMRPYLVQIFESFGVPIDSSWCTVVIGALGFAANVLCMCIIKPLGKRKLAIFSMFGVCLSILALAVYSYFILPSGYTSFDKHEQRLDDHGLGYIPMIFIFILAFSTSLGMLPIPWMLLSEVFPFKSRGIASGIAAAANYIMAFVTTKTYYSLEKTLTLFGVVVLYAVVDVLGLIFIYMFIPETERRTLEDIEIHFSDNNKKLTDLKIRKNVSQDKLEKNGCDNKAFEN